MRKGSSLCPPHSNIQTQARKQPRDSRLRGSVCGRWGCSGGSRAGLTHFLFSVGGEKLALVERRRLRLLLLWLLVGWEGTVGHHITS